jgi:hypothetical protein
VTVARQWAGKAIRAAESRVGVRNRVVVAVVGARVVLAL